MFSYITEIIKRIVKNCLNEKFLTPKWKQIFSQDQLDKYPSLGTNVNRHACICFRIVEHETYLSQSPEIGK